MRKLTDDELMNAYSKLNEALGLIEHAKEIIAIDDNLCGIVFMAQASLTTAMEELFTRVSEEYFKEGEEEARRGIYGLA